VIAGSCALLLAFPPGRGLEGVPVVRKLAWGSNGRLGADWQELRYRGRTHYSVHEGEPGPVLRAESRGRHSALVHRIARGAPPDSIGWKWRVLQHPERADPMARERDDRPAAVFVLVRRSLLPWRTRGLLYQWSAARPVGERARSPYAPDIHVITLRNRAAGADWVEETRDLAGDLERSFGMKIGRIDAIGVICDTDNTRGTAIAEFGEIHCWSAELITPLPASPHVPAQNEVYRDRPAKRSFTAATTSLAGGTIANATAIGLPWRIGSPSTSTVNSP
jgi:hypothetical protein